jgi:hypothetical protein
MSAGAATRTSGLPDSYYAPDFLVEVEDKPLDPATKGDVLEVRVVLDIDELASVDLKLNNYDAVNYDLKWSDDEQFRLGNRVHLQLGYADRLISMLRGRITTLSPEFPSDGAPTMTVRVMDGLVVLKDSRPPEDEVTYEKMKDWEIAQRVAQRHGLRFEHDDDGPTHDVVVQRNTDDLVFLTERASRIDHKLFMRTDPETGEDVLHFAFSDPVRIPIGGRPAAVTVIADLSSQPGDAFPLAGVMILETSPAAAGNQDPAVIGIKTLPIASIERRSDGAEWPMLYGAFLWALLPILLVVIVLAVRMPGALRLRLGSPMWSFTDSWSSTITVAGAILTGLIGFAGLPDYGHAMSKKTYGIASLLFSSLIMLAPGVFNLFRRTMSVTSTSGAIVQQTQGLVPFFLAAALLTTAGVLAQLKLLGTLFQDLGTAAVISVQTAAAFTLLTAVLQVVLVVYAGVSTYLTVNEQAVYQAALKAAAANNIAPAPAAAPPAQLPHWKLL